VRYARGQPSSSPPPAPSTAGPESRELATLRLRLAEAETTLRAVHSGEVDALVVAGKRGSQVFTLRGEEHAYRKLIESMNEGALTLTAHAVILYANSCFATMVRCPLERVIGGSLRRFLCAEDQANLRPLLRRAAKPGAGIQVLLSASDGSRVPVRVSTRPLARDARSRATVAMVVTDMTAAREAEERLRALTHRVVEVQEAERARVARELHDNITQLLCGIIFRSQALEDELPAQAGPLRRKARELRQMLGQSADEVVRISRVLHSSVLDQMGLVAVLRETATEFAARTTVSVKLTCAPMTACLPADTELALYRILQEALENIEKHARARHVTVGLRQQGAFVRLVIQDDGIGLDLEHLPVRRRGTGGLGLLSMRERATHVGGTLEVASGRRAGTRIEVRVPVPPAPTPP
jgi:PAS domain S-box-containing protein